MKILVSGFKPFLGEKINPSELLVEGFQEKSQINHNIHTIVLPVEFEKAFVLLQEQIEKVNPDIILMLGQAGGRKKISLEKIALNWNQARAADESGFCPAVGEIYKLAPLALMTSFPVDSLCEFLQSQKLPVSLSFSAGAFVCNNLYYKVLHHYPKLKTVFIHVPFMPEQMGFYKEEADQSKISTMQFAVMQSCLDQIIDYCHKMNY